MARLEHISEDAAIHAGQGDAEMFFRLGLMYANGRDAEPDYVTAHKWFNIAAARGQKQAIAYRRELSDEMSAADVAAAQRAAREWLRLH